MAVEVGLGLRGGDFAVAGEKLEAVEQAEASQVAFAVVAFRIGSEGELHAGGARGVHECDDAGQDGLAQRARFVEGEHLFAQRGAVALGAEGRPGVEGILGVADTADEDGAVEGDAVGFVDVAVGLDERGFRVEDQSVEVKDEGADHGQSPSADRSGREAPSEKITAWDGPVAQSHLRFRMAQKMARVPLRVSSAASG